MDLPNRILVPIDFGSSSLRACDRSVELARELSASVTLLHVVETPGYQLMPTAMNAFREGAERAMSEHADRLRPHVAALETRILEGTPWRALLDAVSELEPGLVIVGTHGRRGIARLALGSVAGHIVRMSPVPVLTVPAHAFENREAAGGRLAAALSTHELPGSPAIVAIGRGALPVADAVAAALGGSLDLWVTTPIVSDGRPVGTMGEDALAYYDADARPLEGREEAEANAAAEVREEATALRGSRTVGPVGDRLVVLVADTLTTATSVMSAVRALSPLGPSAIVLATPVAARGALTEARALVDEVVALETTVLADAGESAYREGKPPSYRASRTILDVLRTGREPSAARTRRAS